MAVRGTKPVVFVAFAVVSFVARMLGWVISRGLLLPAYRLITAVRLRIDRLVSPARNFTVLLLTNRYVFHAMIAVIAVATIAANISARQARAQGVGESSILYNMVADPSNHSTVEVGRTAVADSRYAADASIAATDIDFDYGNPIEQSVTPVALPGVLAPTTLVASPAEESDTQQQKRTEVQDYIVKEGDSLALIAKRFGLDVGTILWANGRTATQYIRPGDTLRIPPVSGVLVTVKKGDTLLSLANTYNSDIADIVNVNRLDAEKTLPIGVELVLPGGEPPEISTPSSRSFSSRNYPRESGRRETVPTITKKPPDADTSNTAVGKLLWPSSGHSITQYYSWHHTGLDIDGDFTSPLYAAHDGVITTAAWNSGGYGLQVVISGTGVMTRYAHASKLFVKVGDVVKRGQTIAMMGSTGRSTGSHLHFEVYINGVRTNPLTYLK
jgi:murein DD-endopeptidase MepM/ murein hydrolase activator NlpD